MAKRAMPSGRQRLSKLLRLDVLLGQRLAVCSEYRSSQYPMALEAPCSRYMPRWKKPRASIPATVTELITRVTTETVELEIVEIRIGFLPHAYLR